LWQQLAKGLVAPMDSMLKEHSLQGCAAVLVLITDDAEPEIIYNLRAKHLKVHAGEVCFPGGKWELQDQSLLATALRETREEIGVSADQIDILGALPIRTTRSGASVQPFVGRIPAATLFSVNTQELEALFSVPLSAFQQGLQVRTDRFELNGLLWRVPAYVYQDYEIWGFTAAVTSDLLELLPNFSEIEH
jgi:8-oxo-dGTP pyrophosphatase MutT (NUDIX family)